MEKIKLSIIIHNLAFELKFSHCCKITNVRIKPNWAKPTNQPPNHIHFLKSTKAKLLEVEGLFLKFIKTISYTSSFDTLALSYGNGQLDISIQDQITTKQEQLQSIETTSINLALWRHSSSFIHFDNLILLEILKKFTFLSIDSQYQQTLLNGWCSKTKDTIGFSQPFGTPTMGE